MVLDLQHRFAARGAPSDAAAGSNAIEPVLSFLRLLFHEREVDRFLGTHPGLQGLSFVEGVLEHFHFGYRVSNRDRENIPCSGRVVIVSNHPVGTLDALALVQLVAEVRRDVRVLSCNLFEPLEPMGGLLLPVAGSTGASRKAPLRAVQEALAAEQAVIVFPLERTPVLLPSGVSDGRWGSAFLRFARRANAPVLPVHVHPRSSSLFYAVSPLLMPLSVLALVREMVLQRGRTTAIRVGEIIPNASLMRPDITKRTLVKMVRRHLYRIGKGRRGVFATEKAIAHPQSRQQIKAELRQAQRLGETRDERIIYLVDYVPDSAVMKEIGRLRELSFRKVGEGSGGRRDLDRYDRCYRHLVLWDNDALEIVGAYRIGETNRIIPKYGFAGLYSHTLFDLETGFEPFRQDALELGRSFVQPAYWGSRALDYLWQGIGAYLRAHPHIRFLCGPVSISANYPKAARDALVHFYGRHYGRRRPMVRARMPYQIETAARQELERLMPGENTAEDFRVLRSYLQHFGFSVPTLYKQYTDVCAPEGVHFLGFNVDPEFANCVDGLICLELKHLKPSKRQRYIDNT